MAEERFSRRPITTRDRAWAKRTAKWLGDIGLRPNTISLLSMVFGALAGAAFVWAGRTSGWARAACFLGAAAGMQLRLLCNLFDGMVAVEGGFKTKSGEIYNEFPDRFSDAVILIGAGYAAPGSEALHALGWLAALLSVATAYARALGAAAGASQHFVGPMAKPQRMALLTGLAVVMAVLVAAGRPLDLVHPVLAVICLGCLLTVGRRVRLVVRELEAR